MTQHDTETDLSKDQDDKITSEPASEDFLKRLEAEIEDNGGEWSEDPAYAGSIGRTMFDNPSSKDNLVSVIVPSHDAQKIPSQSMVEIKSRTDGDGRGYRGIVVEGPFFEPNGLRADAPIIVTSAAQGATFMPQYHAKVYVEITGEINDGELIPPRFRPLPNSPVFVLGANDTAKALNVSGDIQLGLAIGHDDMQVAIPSNRKDVLFRHVGVLGTTGGGKSTTVSRLTHQLASSDIATILIDTEGEYTHVDKETDDEKMKKALERRGLKPEGIKNTQVMHLIGKDTANPNHSSLTNFTLKFDELSPYAVMEILEFNDTQQGRYLKAYDIARTLLQQYGIFPRKNNNKEMDELMELDDMERGVPRLTLNIIYDVVRACQCAAGKELTDDDGNILFQLKTPEFRKNPRLLLDTVNRQKFDYVQSWRKVQGQLGKLLRYGIFDNPNSSPIDFQKLTVPGKVSIIDLSDTNSKQVNNLVIAELLRGVLERQNKNYVLAQDKGQAVKKVMIIIEEAHEFLSAQRVKQMPVLFEQVARIARRGRKRWLGLMFVTQFPQHLPTEVLGLVNNFIMHKITDSITIDRIKRSIGGVDEGLWRRLPNLAPGQAIVNTSSLSRPLLVAIDPTPSKLLMID